MGKEEGDREKVGTAVSIDGEKHCPMLRMKYAKYTRGGWGESEIV